MLKEAKPSAHIPFVNTERDCSILARSFSDSEFVRISLQGSDKVISCLPPGPKLWVDGGVDGLERLAGANEKYMKYIRQFSGADKIADPEFQKKPDPKDVQEFADAVLGACVDLKPAWISVPQLPATADSARNRINRALAEATGRWASKSRMGAQLVLPLIFTHPSQLSAKTVRNPKVALLARCCEYSGARSVWVVDSSIMDQDGSKALEQSRFPALINLHQEILSALPSDTTVVAGPYWGMNIVLWAKGLIKYPVVGLGNQFQYHLPGGHFTAAKTRVALASLKRWVIVSQGFHSWVGAAMKTLAADDPAYAEFSSLMNRFSSLLHGTNREQIASVYKAWFDSVAVAPPSGRALTLFQQLSSAYVLGKGLPELPKDENSARRPERVAQQLMLVCL